MPDYSAKSMMKAIIDELGKFPPDMRKTITTDRGKEFTCWQKRGYQEEVKRKAIKYYLEGLGFRQIEILMHVSHVSVINWVKKAAEEIHKEEDKREKKKIKTEVIELDGMCVNLKKHLAKDKR